MPLVVDSSAIIALALADEDATYANAVLAAMTQHVAVAPTLFWYEVRNVLVTAEKRDRILRADADRFLAKLNRLPITLEHAAGEAMVMELARQHDPTAYDAVYLELAKRSGSRIATLDQKLRDAAPLGVRSTAWTDGTSPRDVYGWLGGAGAFPRKEGRRRRTLLAVGSSDGISHGPAGNCAQLRAGSSTGL